MAAAITLLLAGRSVCVIEARDVAGGGLHSTEEQGFIMDECSAIHPMGVLSPFFRTLDLHEQGLSFCSGESSVAHPFIDRPAAILYRDFERTGERLSGRDGQAWRRIFEPLLPRSEDLLLDLMGPLNLWPRHLPSLLRFAWLARRSALSFGEAHFEGMEARALFSGLSSHSILPLEMRLTAAFGMIFGLSGHLVDWPCARGGSRQIAQALVKKFESLGGELRLAQPIKRLSDLPPSKVVLFDVAPQNFVRITEETFSSRYRRRLLNYRYGPGTFKVDWTLSESIPWRDPAVRGASTVHVGGTDAQIAASEGAAYRGEIPAEPSLIVCQQSEMDPSRAPAGRQTGYAYCHVPGGFDGTMTEAIEAQMERFAPGFRQTILTRRATAPRDFEALNPNYVGGAVTGGAADWTQLFTRPVARLDPYSTPDPRLFLCSASTPPGGGVHGMCGYYAARSALKRLGGHPPRLHGAKR